LLRLHIGPRTVWWGWYLALLSPPPPLLVQYRSYVISRRSRHLISFGQLKVQLLGKNASHAVLIVYPFRLVRRTNITFLVFDVIILSFLYTLIKKGYFCAIASSTVFS
jgi:hypothetical protein